MRFALLEAKMALIELLKKYTFVRAPDTEVKKGVVINFINFMVHSLHFLTSGSTADSHWCYHVTKEWHLPQGGQQKFK